MDLGRDEPVKVRILCGIDDGRVVVVRPDAHAELCAQKSREAGPDAVVRIDRRPISKAQRAVSPGTKRAFLRHD